MAFEGNYDKWNSLAGAEDEETKPGLPKTGINVEDTADQGAGHRCKLSANQVHEIFAKTYVPNSAPQSAIKAWRHEVDDVPFLRAAPMTEGGGLPEEWQLETLDTHRW